MLAVLLLAGCSTSSGLPELPPTAPEQDRFIREQQAALEADPNDATAHFNLARIYYQQQLYPEAEQAVRQASRLDPLNPDYAELRGSLALARRQYPEAIKEFSNAQRLDPERISVYLKLATAYEQVRDYSLGIASLEEALQREPQYVEALFLLARLQLKQSDYEGAKRAVNSLLLLEPGNYEAKLLRIRIYMAQGSYYYAQTLALELRNSHPESREVPRLLLHLEFLRQRWPEALNLLDEIEQRRPLELEERVLQALVLLQLGQVDSVEPLLTEMLQAAPANVDVLMAHAVLKLRRGQLRDALEWLRRVLEVDASMTRAHFLKAALLFRLGDFLQGDLALKQALRLEPNNLSAQVLQLQRQLMQGQITAVGTKLTALREQNPLQVELLHLQALWHEAQGQFAEAQAFLQQALQGDDSELLRFELARVYYLQGKPALALPLTETLRSERGDSWEVLYLHSLVLTRLDRSQEAEQFIRPFLSRPESLGYAHRLLGDLFRYQGQEDAAQKVLREGLDRFPLNLYLVEGLSDSYASTGKWEELRSLLEISFARQRPQGPLRLLLLDRLTRAYWALDEVALAQEALRRYHAESDPLTATPSFLLEDPALFPVMLPAFDREWDTTLASMR